MKGVEERQLVIPEGTRTDRADKLLAGLVPELSRSRWQKLFQSGRVWRDDEVLSQKSKLRAGDVVEYSLPPAEPLELRPVPMDLKVVFEDEYILILDKKAGVVVHPGAGTGEDTLVHGLLHHCRGSLSGIGGKERPGIVHRLDKETSGILVVAKNDAAFSGLAEQFSGRSIEKFYTALVRGVPEPRCGTIEEPIGRHPVHRLRMTCRPDGREARTDYEVWKSWEAVAALVRLQIHTGRTHQIRVHLKQLGHSLLGDGLYGYRESFQAGSARVQLPPVPRVMLHATELRLKHPVSGEGMVVEAPLPADFRMVCGMLDKAFAHEESR